MTSTAPPRIATWMLLHLVAGDRDEALAGDLLESFHAGRSSAWYWRQVLVAIAIRWMGRLFRYWPSLIFAVAWATISPAWGLLIIRLYQTSNLIGPVWRLPWPWSTVCMFGLSAAEDLVFVWTGALIYLFMLLGTTKTAKHWKLVRAFTASIAGYVLVRACEFVVALIFASYWTTHGVDWRTLTLSGEVANFGARAILFRVPYLVGTACALWGAAPTGEPPMKLVE